jgi:hypothetical protein
MVPVGWITSNGRSVPQLTGPGSRSVGPLRFVAQLLRELIQSTPR